MGAAVRILVVYSIISVLTSPSHAGSEIYPPQIVSLYPSVALQPDTGPIHWYWLNPRPSDANMQDVTFTDPTTAIAVGYGTVIRTTDGGYS
jgi:hypothetical protein